MSTFVAGEFVAQLKVAGNTPTAQTLETIGIEARRDPDNAVRLCKEGICEVTLNVCRNPTAGQADVIGKACYAMHSLIVGAGDVARKALTDAGVCNIIVDILKSLTAESNVVEHACWAVKNLCAGESFIERATTFASAGICDLLMNILTLHPNHPGVVHQALGAIGNLSSVYKDEISKKFADAGACEATVNATESFLINSDITKQACWTICNLASEPSNEEMREQMTNAGACEVVVKAWAAWPTEPWVVHYACGAIINLTAGNSYEEKCRRLADAGVIPLALRALDTPMLIKQACWVIFNMATSPTVKVKFLEGGALTVLTKLKGAAVPFAEDIMERINDAIAALSSAYVFEERFLEKSMGLDLVPHAVSYKNDKEEMVSYACAMVRNSKLNANVHPGDVVLSLNDTPLFSELKGNKKEDDEAVTKAFTTDILANIKKIATETKTVKFYRLARTTDAAESVANGVYTVSNLSLEEADVLIKGTPKAKDTKTTTTTTK